MDAMGTMLALQGIQAANAAADQAKLQNQIASEQLAWAKTQWADAKAQNQPIIDRLVKGMDFQDQYAREQKDLYDTTYRPIEQDFARKAMAYDTPERREQEAGYAAADVAQQFEGARQASAQQLRDYGIDPTASRYAATDFTSRISQAATTAGAMNMARRNVEGMGFQLQGAAINTGRGYPGAINQTAGVGQSAGNSAVGNTNDTLKTGSAVMTAPSAYYQNANQALATWGNIANNNQSNYMEGYKFDNTPRSSGIGSALGLAAGIGARAYMGGLAEGGAIPPEASPSGGAAVDDVPARVNVGEFVMPKEAVSWFGEKAMHDMILKAQKQRAEIEQQSGAVPDVMPVGNENPSLISGGAQKFANGGSALPMRLPYGQRYNPETDKFNARDAKGIGFRGPVSNGDHIVSEYSRDDDIQYPSVYQGITDPDLARVMMAERLNQPKYQGDDMISERLNRAQAHASVPQDVDGRAYAAAKQRTSAGRSPFFEQGRDPYPAWSPDQHWQETATQAPRKALPVR